MSIQETIHQMGRQARAAAYKLAQLTSDEKNDILRAMAAAIRRRTPELLAANVLDLAAGEAKGLSNAMLDRLKLDEKRIEAMAAGIDQVATLPDPVGEIMDAWDRPNGIRISQTRVPIGTIGIIYESRPNVTADAAVLCFKTGNATILRGGSEAIHSNVAIASALAEAGAPEHAIQLIPFTDRESVAVLAGMDKWLDLIIPRGGKGLIETVVSLARMPVIKHYDGICHLFADKDADLEMASTLAVNSKTQKPGVCNALEILLVHRDIATGFLPKVATALREKNVEIRGCANVLEILPDAKPATAEDWDTEFLELIIAVKIVDSLEEAVAHINEHGSHHTDVIVTRDEVAAEQFLGSVDSACVFHNCSTRFADGGEFGFGAEIGISTDKLHARGPMGLRELTSYQYRVRGNGQVKG
ncbi:glutamate-5-semialdehyde dehydrogenase [Luteolibacter yonseiensis]|uniref:Gamma-glutamyl phosphate reductase n=1 Tax=Luteolibacter yonseiensis TaxID=1144680 RepID=A0A934V664_9BACT|nr:glutamate-5-semialdehyde dehydrogenase [Luteolibacter yonseiensis]MBK1814702.1 glutamate-5-semialdehyde dehydrogenase [Luteolibacter yonseiensis]